MAAMGPMGSPPLALHGIFYRAEKGVCRGRFGLGLGLDRTERHSNRRGSIRKMMPKADTRG